MAIKWFDVKSNTQIVMDEVDEAVEGFAGRICFLS
jgi:hypothetical protein